MLTLTLVVPFLTNPTGFLLVAMPAFFFATPF